MDTLLHMRIYLTHCSKEKDSNLQGTDRAVPPDQLYTDAAIQQFMQTCKAENVNWGILSDLYGLYLPDECHVCYEKHPDTVTPSEEETIVQTFNNKLGSYDEICFWVRPDSFHPFYARVLQQINLANNVYLFQDLRLIR